MTVTVSHSVLCCCVCVTSFELRLTPLFVESAHALGLVLFQIVVYVEKIISAATEIQR